MKKGWCLLLLSSKGGLTGAKVDVEKSDSVDHLEAQRIRYCTDKIACLLASYYFGIVVKCQCFV